MKARISNAVDWLHCAVTPQSWWCHQGLPVCRRSQDLLLKHKPVSVQTLQQLKCTLRHLTRNKSTLFVLGFGVVIFKLSASNTQCSRRVSCQKAEWLLPFHRWCSIETVKMTSAQTHKPAPTEEQSALPTKLENKLPLSLLSLSGNKLKFWPVWKYCGNTRSGKPKRTPLEIRI